jgi:hypothetical protein
VCGRPLGPVVHLCALRAAQRWSSRRALGGRGALEITEGTGWLIGQLQAVRTALRRIDARNWPTTPPPRLAAVAAMYPNGKVRWFLYDPRDESVTPALPPDPLPDLTSLEEMARVHDFEEFGGRALSVLVDSVTTAKPGASRFPAASVLVPRDHEAVAARRRRSKPSR